MPPFPIGFWKQVSNAVLTQWGLWNTGLGTSGASGDNTTTTRWSPVQVGTLTSWTKIGGAGGNGFAINNLGQLYAWGGNNPSLIGDNTNTSRSSPVQIGTLTNWALIGGKSATVHAITTGGALWGWGAANTGNSLGTLGTNVATTSFSSPVQVGTLTNWASVGHGPNAYHSGAIDTSGQLWMWGQGASGQLGQVSNVSNFSSPVQVGTDTDWSSVALIGANTMALKTTGKLYQFGANNVGQLGNNTSTGTSSPVQIGTLTNWAQIAGGNTNAGAIKTDGTLWSWGYGGLRTQVGDGTITTKSSPVQLGTLTNWTKVMRGATHGIALNTAGQIWGWGSGLNGQLGDLTSAPNSSPVQVGTLTNWTKIAGGISFATAVRSDGTLWTWGLNTVGVLGTNDGVTLAASSPVQIGTLTNWTIVAAGQSHAGAINSLGQLWTWGQGTSGQQGNSTAVNHSSPVQVGTLTNWVSIAGSRNAFFGVDSSNKLWAWGSGAFGALGQNSTANKSSPTQIGTLTNWLQVAGGDYQAFAIKTDNSLWAWGHNSTGQTGDNTAGTDRSSPVQVGTLTNWSFVSAKATSANAITTTGQLWAWGANNSGQLGLGTGDTTIRSSPTQVGTLTNWIMASMGANAQSMTKTDGTLWAVGIGTSGGLGNNNGIANIQSPVQVGTLTNWGTTAGTVQDVSNFGFNVKTDGSLWGWGYRALGHLGDSKVDWIQSPTQIGTLTSWADIVSRSNNTEMLRG